MNLEEVLDRADIRWPNNRKIECPKHIDRTASLHLYDDDRWYCFSCGAHGRAGDLLFALTGVYPSGNNSPWTRTEGSKGVSAYAVRHQVDTELERIGAQLHIELFYDAPAWLILQAADAEYEARIDLKGVPPFEARDGLAQWESYARTFGAASDSWRAFMYTDTT